MLDSLGLRWEGEQLDVQNTADGHQVVGAAVEELVARAVLGAHCH